MYIRLHVTPESKRESLSKVTGGHFKVTVCEVAKNNQANKRALEVLANHLNVPKQKLRIMSGHKTPRKTVFLRP